MTGHPRPIYDDGAFRVAAPDDRGRVEVLHRSAGHYLRLPPDAVAAIARAHAERQRQVLVGADWLWAVEGFIPRHPDEETE